MDKQTASAVAIDEHALDKECIRLPSDYLKFAHIAAEAKRNVDEAKGRLDVVQAELASKIRRNPEKYRIEKVTESVIDATVKVQKEYLEAAGEYNEAKHEHELAQAVVWAMEHKKRSLTLLVELHGQGYYSEVKVSERGKAAVQEQTTRAVRTKRRERHAD